MTNKEKKDQRFFMVEASCDANMEAAKKRVKKYCEQLKEHKVK